MIDGIEIRFNGELRTVKSRTVSDLLIECELAGRKVAVERNRLIVPRAEHASTTLSPGDSVEVVHFVGGG